MALDFVWWCNECEQEVDTPEDHSQTYPAHTYIEKMRWTGDTITPIVPEVVQESIDGNITTMSGVLQNMIETVSEYYYISDDTLKSTTSTSWVNRLTLSVGLEDEGWYRVGWSFMWNYSHTSKTAGFQIIVDGDEEHIISENYIEPKDNQTYQRFPLCGLNLCF